MKYALLSFLLVGFVLLGCTQPAAPTATPQPSVLASAAPTVDAGVSAEVGAVDTDLGDLESLDELTAGDLDPSDFDRLG